MSSVTVYGRPECPWCEKAKNLLESHSIPYTYVDVWASDENLQALKTACPGAKTVPQIVYNGKNIGGYTELAEYMEYSIGGHGEQSI